jgi:hypothetical protein
VLEHRRGVTAVDIEAVDDRWSVTSQMSGGPIETVCRAVIVATGGYVEARGSRAIAGPRPSGVITVEFAERALEAGVLPGRRAVVVGPSLATDELVVRLQVAGVQVVSRIEAEPDAIHGAARLEDIETGGRRVACDTLVLADRRLPLNLLLATTGLISGAVGEAAPADERGRLPLGGLWAAGCCVRPDASHRHCGADGGRVGRDVVASLQELIG